MGDHEQAYTQLSHRGVATHWSGLANSQYYSVDGCNIQKTRVMALADSCSIKIHVHCQHFCMTQEQNLLNSNAVLYLS